jgi:ABC-type multidrug transport system fused ATPase/permease subunit
LNLQCEQKKKPTTKKKQRRMPWSRDILRCLLLAHALWGFFMTLMLIVSYLLDNLRTLYPAHYVGVFIPSTLHVSFVYVNVLLLIFALRTRSWSTELQESLQQIQQEQQQNIDISEVAVDDNNNDNINSNNNNNNDNNIDNNNNSNNRFTCVAARVCQDLIKLNGVLLILMAYTAVITYILLVSTTTNRIDFLFQGAVLLVLMLFFVIAAILAPIWYILGTCCADALAANNNDDAEERGQNHHHHHQELELPSRHGVVTVESISKLSGRPLLVQIKHLYDQQIAEDRPAQCSICLGDLLPGQQLQQLDASSRGNELSMPLSQSISILFCQHAFHSGCLNKWLVDNNHTVCPLCRQRCATKVIPQFFPL